mmetsp:Transcript_48771/g.138407  ORF Transcript_48771/g.138407 Transcript_48771/m.138407 type:complete len:154 (+) Transcript_48771:732-1193(+)
MHRRGVSQLRRHRGVGLGFRQSDPESNAIPVPISVELHHDLFDDGLPEPTELSKPIPSGRRRGLHSKLGLQCECMVCAGELRRLVCRGGCERRLPLSAVLPCSSGHDDADTGGADAHTCADNPAVDDVSSDPAPDDASDPFAELSVAVANFSA